MNNMMILHLDLPSDDGYWDAKFSKSILDPNSWIATAKDLIFSLLCSRPQIIEFYKATIECKLGESVPVNKRLQGIYMLLGAYAAENLMKAIIIKSNFSEISHIKQIPKEIKSHNLLSLAAKAHISLTDYGLDLLKRMSYFSIWAGRYPAPLSVGDIKPESTSLSNSLNCFRGFDIRAIDEILFQCAKILRAEEILSIITIGNSDDIEEWERVVMQNSITPWDNGVIKGSAI